MTASTVRVNEVDLAGRRTAAGDLSAKVDLVQAHHRASLALAVLEHAVVMCQSEDDAASEGVAILMRSEDERARGRTIAATVGIGKHITRPSMAWKTSERVRCRTTAHRRAAEEVLGRHRELQVEAVGVELVRILRAAGDESSCARARSALELATLVRTPFALHIIQCVQDPVVDQIWREPVVGAVRELEGVDCSVRGAVDQSHRPMASGPDPFDTISRVRMERAFFAEELAG